MPSGSFVTQSKKLLGTCLCHMTTSHWRTDSCGCRRIVESAAFNLSDGEIQTLFTQKSPSERHFQTRGQKTCWQQKITEHLLSGDATPWKLIAHESLAKRVVSQDSTTKAYSSLRMSSHFMTPESVTDPLAIAPNKLGKNNTFLQQTRSAPTFMMFRLGERQSIPSAFTLVEQPFENSA